MKRRADDTATTVMARLDAYYAQTQPLIDYYERKEALKRVDAMERIEAISNELAGIVEGLTTGDGHPRT